MRKIPREQLQRKLADAFRDGRMVRETLYQAAAMYRMLLDPQVPAVAKAEVVGALVYLLNPFDLVPDMLPMGLVDDVAMLGVVWGLVRRHITDEHRQEGRRMVIDLLARLNLTREIAS